MGLEKILLIFFLALCFTSQMALAERRVALVIGNSAYAKSIPLANPTRDASSIGGMLRKVGFDVVETKTDIGIDAMRKALRAFSEQAQDSDIAVVFYAGHGMEIAGQNYLIPTDAQLARDTDVEDEAISLDRVVRTIEPAKKFRLVILDSCRDNPFVRSIKRSASTRSIGRGLAEYDEKSLSPSTLVAYAQKAGYTADDGAKSNSPYTIALLRHLATPGLDLRIALGRVRDEVLQATARQQEPFVYGSLGGDETPLVPAGTGLTERNTGTNTPVFQADTAGHTGAIRDIAVAGRFAISAGNDNALRVWDLNKGETVRRFAAASAIDDVATLQAMAVSQTDNLVAVGDQSLRSCPGVSCSEIRLYNYATGSPLGAFKAHTSSVTALAFSPDGKTLASSGLDDKIHIWNVSERRAMATLDLDSGAQPQKIAYLPDNLRIAIGERSGWVKVYNTKTQLIERAWQFQGTIRAIATSGDGRYIVAGGSGGKLFVIDGANAWKITTIENSSSISALAFGAGNTAHGIIAGSDTFPFKVNIWDADDGSLIASIDSLHGPAQAVASSESGNLICSAGGARHEIQFVSIQHPERARIFRGVGGTIFSTAFITFSYMQKDDALPKSATPQRREELYLAWGRQNPCESQPSCPDVEGKLEFALRLPDEFNPTIGRPEVLSDDGKLRRRFDPGDTMSIRRGEVASGAMRLIRFDDGNPSGLFPSLAVSSVDKFDPVLLYRRGTGEGADHTSYSFDSDATSVFSGGRNGMLESFALTGKRQTRFIAHYDDVRSLALSPAGDLLATGSADHTVRLWNPATGELIATLLHEDEDEWVLWTPQGYYTSSPRGDRQVGWIINSQAGATYVTARNARRHFFRPEVIAASLDLRSAAAGIDKLGLNTGFQLADLETVPKPKLRMKLTGRGGVATIAMFFEDQVAARVESVTIYVNEKKHGQISGPFNNELKLEIGLEAGANTVRVIARGAEVSTEIVDTVVGTATVPHPPKGTLVAIAIGVGHYRDKATAGGAQPPADLATSAKDARAVLNMVVERFRRRHSRVETILLVDDGAEDATTPTKVNIERIIDRLRQTTPDDTLVLYLGGHGINLPNEEGYVFLPSDAQYGENGWDSAHLVKWVALESALSVANGRRFVFVDTSRSAGSAFNEIKLLADDEVVVFSAASRDQDAWKFPGLEHSVFVTSLLEALSGKADRDGDRQITISEFGAFVVERTMELTQGEQSPGYFRPVEGRDYVMFRY